MKVIDVKSLIIGILFSVVVVFSIAAASGSGAGRYNASMSVSGGDVSICLVDTQTGQSCLGQFIRRAPASSATLELIGTFNNLIKTE